MKTGNYPRVKPLKLDHSLLDLGETASQPSVIRSFISDTCHMEHTYKHVQRTETLIIDTYVHN